MHITKQIVFWLMTFLSLSFLQTSTTPVIGARALREECSAYSQAGMRDCLSKKAVSSETSLQQTKAKVSRALTMWDEDKTYASQAKANLAISNKDFSKYRDTECKFLASLNGGAASNAHEIRRLACVAELNNRRDAVLTDAISDLALR